MSLCTLMRAYVLRTYSSIDPAPPTSGLLAGKAAPEDASEENIAKLRNTLNDSSLPLFDRYRAMFALRNIGTPAAVDALASGFSDDSALFKHEIAFVFGQLLSTHSVPALLQVLQNSQESDMVRHEAAEALGGIATPEVLPYLKEWMKRPDAPRVVRESCQVAIDMWEVCMLTLQSPSKVTTDHVSRSMRTQTNSSTRMDWTVQRLGRPLERNDEV